MFKLRTLRNFTKTLIPTRKNIFQKKIYHYRCMSKIPNIEAYKYDDFDDIFHGTFKKDDDILIKKYLKYGGDPNVVNKFLNLRRECQQKKPEKIETIFMTGYGITAVTVIVTVMNLHTWHLANYLWMIIL